MSDKKLAGRLRRHISSAQAMLDRASEDIDGYFFSRESCLECIAGRLRLAIEATKMATDLVQDELRETPVD